MCARQEVYHDLGDSQEMSGTKSRSNEVTKSRRDEVWIGQPDSQRTVDVEETPASTTLAVVQWY